MTDSTSDDPQAVKDPDASHPIAMAWRPVLAAVVRALVQRDYQLACGVAGVDDIPSDTAAQIRDYIEDYGANLVELPDEAWTTSCAQWMGDHRDILIDLWTVEEGSSDLVLGGSVRESDAGPRFTVHMVYVP